MYNLCLKKSVHLNYKIYLRIVKIMIILVFITTTKMSFYVVLSTSVIKKPM